jgi:PAS domain S-box-containing protein
MGAIKVLLVEDNPGDARLVQEMLTDASESSPGLTFRVSRAERLTRALDILAAESFDLILLDLSLPDSHGLDTVHQTLDTAPELPVVVMSGLGNQDVALAAVQAGAQDYLVKGHVDEYSLPRAIHYAIERKRAERALRESEELFRQIVDINPNCIFIKDAEGRYILANEAMAELYGTTPEEIVGKTERDLSTAFGLKAEEAGQFAADDREVVEGKRSKFIPEEPLTLADGTTRWFQITKVPISLGSVPDGVLGVAVDITERKQAEDERNRLLARIQEQARRVQQIVDTVPEGVLLLDAEGQVILANPQAKTDLATLADAKVGDVLTHIGGRPVAEFLTSPPKGLWHEVARGDRHFETIARPLETETQSQAWVLVIRDVTQERKVQQQTRQQERLAAIGQLAGGIAHDFNNLLTTIMLYSEMLLARQYLPPDMVPGLEIIIEEARQAANLVGQILDFSRRSPIETRPIDLKSFTKEAVKILQRTLPENIRLNTRFEAGEYVVDSDPTRIQQVLMNLALNARDAMPEGGELQIKLTRIEVSPDGDSPIADRNGLRMDVGTWVCLSVSDTGTGIPPKALPHIFEPFFTTKSPGKGTGLGLAQVYGIVKQHEGHIDVKTRMDQGTTFRIYLPAHSTASVKQVLEEATTLPQGKGETILLVEDQERIRELGQRVLESIGYRVLTAANGREALAAYDAEERVDVVITDLIMPEMGGKRLIQELRETQPDLRALAITGYVMPEELQGLGQEYFQAVIQKPFDVNVLAQSIRRVLDTDSKSE